MSSVSDNTRFYHIVMHSLNSNLESNVQIGMTTGHCTTMPFSEFLAKVESEEINLADVAKVSTSQTMFPLRFIPLTPADLESICNLDIHEKLCKISLDYQANHTTETFWYMEFVRTPEEPDSADLEHMHIAEIPIRHDTLMSLINKAAGIKLF